MPLKAYPIRAGVVRDMTRYADQGGWYLAQWIRFRMGLPEVIGGWSKMSTATFAGVCRDLHAWAGLDNQQLVSLGTSEKFYVFSQDNKYHDITPLRSTVTVTNPFLTKPGTITATVTAHGAQVGDWVLVSNAAAVGGIALNGEWKVKAVPDANTFVLDIPGDENATVASGGGSVTFQFRYPSGRVDDVSGAGWGMAPWGQGGWGQPAFVVGTQGIRLWSADNYGEDLVYCPMDGPVYYWDKSAGYGPGVPLSQLPGASDAPTVAHQILVTPDRHVFALGANAIGSTTQDPLLVRWCDQDVGPAYWTPDTTHDSGSLRLGVGSRIVGGLRTRAEVLVCTERSLHSFVYTGPPYTYTHVMVSDNISVLGMNAMVDVGNSVLLMGNNQFYAYAGSAVTPLPCPLRDYVYSHLNQTQARKCFAAINRKFSEAWFFYPTGDEIDSYVLVNLVDASWSYGSIVRTAWLDPYFDEGPLAAGADQYLYCHEEGEDADGQPLNAFVESADVDLDGGDHFLFVTRMLPDVMWRGPEMDQEVAFTVRFRNGPAQAFSTTQTLSCFRENPDSTMLYLRGRGRQAVIRAESNQVGTSWRLGLLRFDVRPDGRR
jgi:hypothetical protein